MTVATLKDAYRERWKLTARCAYGKRDGMKSIRECIHRTDLNLSTLMWTRGDAFPLAQLESRLKCPRCGSRQVSVIIKRPDPATGP